jgi:hypothetical protein
MSVQLRLHELRSEFVEVPQHAALATATGCADRESGRRVASADIVHMIDTRGLRLPARLSYECWLSVGTRLATVLTSTAWCLGDWLVYGETAFTGRYRDAIEQTGLVYQTLRNYAWVTRRFPLSRRRDGLSFSHHAEVVSLPEPEQDFWLRKAEELSWSRNELRRELQASLQFRRKTSGQVSSASDATGFTLKLRVPISQLKICRQAANHYGLSVEDWVLRTLELAATQALTSGQIRSRATA